MPLKKLSKTKISVLIFSVSILCLTLAFFLSGLTWKQIVDAFALKGPHSTLTVNDWNGLMNDFVKKSGDTMTGSLTISNGSLNVNSGNINVSGKITAGSDISAGGSISATHDINAGGQITASKICMGGNCRSSWPISTSHFGGMYSQYYYAGYGWHCYKKNPYTNNCSCPNGYINYIIFGHGWAKITSEPQGIVNNAVRLFLCYKP